MPYPNPSLLICSSTYPRISLGLGNFATIFPFSIKGLSIGSVSPPQHGHLG